MRARRQSCAPVAPRQVDSRRTAPPQVRQTPPLARHREPADGGVRLVRARSVADGRALGGLPVRRRRSCHRATRAAPSRTRSLHQAQRFAPHTRVHRARAPRGRVRPATLRHQVVRDRMAHDSSTTPPVRRDVAVAARVRVALARHSRPLEVRQKLRTLSALAQVECQRVAAHLRHVGAGPLLTLS